MTIMNTRSFGKYLLSNVICKQPSFEWYLIWWWLLHLRRIDKWGMKDIYWCTLFIVVACGWTPTRAKQIEVKAIRGWDSTKLFLISQINRPTLGEIPQAYSYDMICVPSENYKLSAIPQHHISYMTIKWFIPHHN